MVEILPNAHTDSAYAAVVTVIYVLLRVVVPELADVAIIASRGFTTFLAGVRRFLDGPAEHAQHMLSVLPR
jgi:hypothetical protein